jgi:hypothetical protein
MIALEYKLDCFVAALLAMTKYKYSKFKIHNSKFDLYVRTFPLGWN